MRQLSLAEFESAHIKTFDDKIAETQGIDQFCSSSAWIMSAYEAFAQDDASPWIFEGDAGYAALYQSWHERIGRFAQPFEASWCLASPFATTEPTELAEEFFREMHARRTEWDLLFLSGLPRDSVIYAELATIFSSHYFVGIGPGVLRHRASLEGGVDGYLSRRKSKFRANFRRLGRRAEDDGVQVEMYSASGEDASSVDWMTLYDRMLDLETQSWKGQEQSGIQDEHMRKFYRFMIPRLVAQGSLRIMFLTLDGEDIAFIFGAVSQGLYRGLQVSFHDAYRKLSPGNLAQIHMIQYLCDEDVKTYDLGSELEYKYDWAEDVLETVPLVIRPW